MTKTGNIGPAGPDRGAREPLDEAPQGGQKDRAAEDNTWGKALTDEEFALALRRVLRSGDTRSAG